MAAIPSNPADSEDTASAAGDSPKAEAEPKRVNPPIDEKTRHEFAEQGIFQHPEDGRFIKVNPPKAMETPGGRPMSEDEVRATFPGAPQNPSKDVATQLPGAIQT